MKGCTGCHRPTEWLLSLETFHRECEGRADCMLASRLKKDDDAVFTVLTVRCPKCGEESSGFEPAAGNSICCPKCGHTGQVRGLSVAPN